MLFPLLHVLQLLPPIIGADYIPRLRRSLFKANGQRQIASRARLKSSATTAKERKGPGVVPVTRSICSQRKAIAKGQVTSQASAVRTSIRLGLVASSARNAPRKGET